MNIQFTSEILGTIAFAISGAMLAIERKMDIFGVLFLGLVTAMGGGFMRDVVLGKVPPGMFLSPVFVTVGIVASLYTYFMIHWNQHMIPRMSEGIFQWVLNFTDAIGLGLFTVVGVNTAIDAGYGRYHMLCIFLGMLTGVGGGMLRDIMAGLTPAILRKHVYACASLLGAVCYAGLICVMPRGYAMFAGSIIVIAVRMMAYHFKWNLPKAI
ncbi:MAG: trimeric intracellular cation channel family protein [Clostridiales bacterium]|nr:trimeric intracellular cation channel family protein [Clostridiales bacterium]